ncbi:MAG TPA: hypothetical protein VNI77_11260 [Nitrososphaera sp.]|nr:hypothetical protein [Nitrososphaera sp.]
MENELKSLVGKQVIRYEPTHDVEPTTAVIKRPRGISEYLCHMCDDKFGRPQEPQEHRVGNHQALTGIELERIKYAKQSPDLRKKT